VSWLVSIVVTSLLGSLHCVGMCGGLVSFYSGNGAGASRGMRLHAGYHLARLGSYATLGALAGGLGSSLDLAGERAGLGAVSAWVAGGTMIAWGLVSLLGARRDRTLLAIQPKERERGLRRRLESQLAGWLARLRGRPPLARAALLGLATGLLPCGWLYAFVLMAAGTGAWHEGASVMLAFWLGSLPGLLGLGFGVRYLARRFGALVPRLSAALLVALGIASIAAHFPSPARADAGSAPPACHAVD